MSTKIECDLEMSQKSVILQKTAPSKGPKLCSAIAAIAATPKSSGGSKFFRQGELDVSESEVDTLKGMSDADSVISDVSMERERVKYLRSSRKRAAIDDKDSDTRKSDCRKKAVKSRGRASTSENNVTQAAAKAAVELDIQAQERATREHRAQYGYGVASVLNYEQMSVADLEETANQDAEKIIGVALKSGNLKGDLMKTLKDRTCSLLAITTEIAKRSASKETLQATVQRLTEELSAVRAEMQALRDGQAAATPTSLEERTASLVADMLRQHAAQERNFTRSCIAGLEDRLLPEPRRRPPLASDKVAATAATKSNEPTLGGFKAPPLPKGKGKGVGKKSKDTDALTSQKTATPPYYSEVVTASTQASTSTAADVLLPSTTPANDAWRVVSRKKKAKKAFTLSSAPDTNANTDSVKSKRKRQRTKKAAPKMPTLVPPKTAAVVVTLTADAVEKGVTYEKALKKAREAMDEETLEKAKAKCRQTMTGARIFEFPGAESTERADIFAEHVRQAIAEVARVVRPVKCATLLVSDLDDSVTKEEVVTKVALVGGCSPDQIKSGNLWIGRGGMRALRLTCPVTAVKKVLDGGRFLVGWCSATVRVLEERPLRCYKCLCTGHTSACCPSAASRAELCFRCGKSGHKATTCSDKPHCPVCAEAGKPAGHNMGGRKCNPPPKKGKLPAAIRATVSVAAESSVVQEEGVMSE